MTNPRRVAVLVVLAAAARAQTVHVVGAGGFSSIDAALAVSSPGDVIDVQPGTWPRFTAGIGVLIRGAPGANVQGVSVSVAAVPAGQTLHLVGLQVAGLAVIGGTVTIDGCQVRPFPSATTEAALTVVGGHVHLQGCDVTGAWSATALPQVAATRCTANAVVTAIDSQFVGGGSATVYFPVAAPGIDLDHAVFEGSHVVVRGGSSVGAILAANALRSVASTVWISDSTLQGGTEPWGTECWLDPWVSPGSNPGRVVRSTLVPGACSISVPTSGSLLGVHRVAPLSSPGPVTLAFTADPNALVAVVFSVATGFADVPGIEQPLLVDLANPAVLDLLLADAAGNANGAWTMPPGFTGTTVWLQGIAIGAGAWQPGPLAGGVIR